MPSLVSSVKTVTITVTNVNEFHPEFQTTIDRVSVPENISLSTEIYQARANDSDYGKYGEIHYAIIDGNDSGYFIIDPQTGIISVAKQLDRETTPLGVNLTVEATGLGASGSPNTSKMVLQVHITDVNDNSPVFNLPIANGEVPEQAAVGTVVEQVQATDADIGVNAVITYSIIAGNSLGFFKIDTNTGEVKVNKSLDLETVTHVQGLSYSLTIEARDQGTPPRATSANLAIQVSQVNEFTPEFDEASDTTSVQENALVSTQFYKARANDSDYGTDGDIEYSIIPGDAVEYFSINSQTGMVSVARLLDRETTPYGINLTIEATDLADIGQRKTTTMELHIEIMDYNDNSPVFNLPIPSLSVSEQDSIGTVIEQVQATDADLGVNAAITFSIIAGNSLGFFDIDSTTGEIKVKKSLDLETQSHNQDFRYTLTVEARDNGVPPLASTEKITIQVNGVNEYPPRFNKGRDNVTVPENTTLFTAVYYVNATDGDAGTDGALEYSILNGNDDGYFTVDQNSSEVKVAKQLDYLATPNGLNLTIGVTDLAVLATARKTANMSLKINVLYVGNTAPVFSPGSLDSTVSEDTPPDITILKINVTDANPGPNGVVSFSIISGNSLGLFKIDQNSGEIKVNKSLDLETQNHASGLTYTLTIQARDHGTPPLTSTKSLNFQVTAVNEFEPVFNETEHTTTIREDASSSTDVYQATANDADYGTDGDVQYSITGGNTAGYFKINSQTGIVSTAKTLDRETIPNGINLTIEATDLALVGFRKTSTMVLRIIITDYNDNSPVFNLPIPPAQVSEQAPVDTVVAQVQATDADIGVNAAITYSITAGNSLGFFKIDTNTGEVKVNKSLDLETVTHVQGLSYSLTIEARDQGTPPRATSANLAIQVSQVNEFTPEFDEASDTTSVQENALVSTQFYKARANDSDYGTDGDIEYSIIPGDAVEYFSINSQTGMVSVARLLDRETTPYGINLTIEATDLADIGQRKTTTMELHIEIMDYNDNSPVFNLPIPSLSVSEQDSIGTVIEQVQATDADLGVNAAITFSIIAGNSLGFFDIDSTTGEIKVKKSLDLETQSHNQDFRYTLTVEARDNGVPPLASTEKITIQVNGVNEYPPRFNKGRDNVTVPENTTLFTAVYYVNATDGDAGTDGALEYSILNGNDDGYFTVDQNSSEVKVAKQLDYLATPNGLNLTIGVTDLAVLATARKTANMSLKINVLYVGNTAPVFSPGSLDSTVSEDTPPDITILKINVTDANPGPNGVVSFSIISGNSLGLFKIDQNSGEIKVNKSLDLETQNHASGLTYTLTIQARDHGTPPLTSTKSLNFQVTAVNEFEPVFNETEHTTTIREDASSSTDVYQATANDADYGTDGDVQYSITGGNTAGYFKINSQTGIVSTAKTLDRETIPNGINLTIEATDLALVGFRKTSTMVLRIIITDYNDNSPVFNLPIPPAQVSEQAPVDTVVAQVQATDADLGVNAVITFSITAGNSLEFFKIESSTGEVKVNKSLDLETESHAQGLTYTLTIEARDQGIPSNAATESMTIQVNGVNEFTPALEKTKDYITVAHNSPQSTVVYQVNASDADFGIDGNLEYSISAGNDDGYVAINRNNGEVTVAKELDHTPVPFQINLTIEVTDLAPLGSRKINSMQLNIDVKNFENTAPVFSQSLPDRIVQEDAPVDTVIIKANVTDANSGPNGVVRFAVISGNLLGYFKIDSNTGDVKVNQSLDLETKTHASGASYRLIIEARDEGSPPLTANESLNIQIIGVNEFTPSVEGGDRKTVMNENSTVKTVVGQIIGSDRDYGNDGKLTYTIVSGNDQGYFSINQSSGKKM